jgi:small subunit ribosomal protein S21
MIVIPIKEGENIERALKKFKRKFEKTGAMKNLRERKYFKKPSMVKREQMIKAIYKQRLVEAEM